MGLTIHYSLKASIRSPKKARERIARLRGRALDLPFAQVEDIVELSGEACDFDQRGQNDPHRWLLIQAGQYIERPAPGGGTYSYNVAPTHVIAFETLPGDGCEAANFGLCRYPAYIEVADLESFLQDHSIPYTRHGEGGGSYNGEIIEYRPGTDPVCTPVDANGNPTVDVNVMRRVAKSLDTALRQLDAGAVRKATLCLEVVPKSWTRDRRV